MSYKTLTNDMDVFIIVHKPTGKIHSSRTNPWYNKIGAAKNAFNKISEYYLLLTPEHRAIYDERHSVLTKSSNRYWELPEWKELRDWHDANRVRVEIRANYEIRKAKLSIEIGEVVPYG